MPRVCGVSGSRHTTTSLRSSTSSSSVKQVTPASFFGRRLQPTTLKPSAPSLRAASLPSSPRPSRPMVRSEARYCLRRCQRRAALLAAVVIVMAVPVEHVREHRLGHRRHHAGVDQARERHAFRERGVGEQPLDAHPQRLHQLQALERLEGARRRRRDQRDVDVLVGDMKKLSCGRACCSSGSQTPASSVSRCEQDVQRHRRAMVASAR